MPIVPLDDLSFSGLAWIFKLLILKHRNTSIWRARAFITTF